jgi:SAM-dependent methyltransferase
MMDGGYSLENARKFRWSSVSGNLHPERVRHLDTHLVGREVLDAGCGGGAYVEYLAERGLTVTGIDLHGCFLDLARREARRGHYVQGSLAELPFPDRRFDSTYCFDVLEHVDDERALRELARVTRRRLIVAVPMEDEVMPRYNLTFLHHQDRTHWRNYTVASLDRLAATVAPASVTVFPELPVPLVDLVRETLTVRGSNRVATSLYSRAFYFLLGRASHKPIHTGLVMVLDL